MDTTPAWQLLRVIRAATLTFFTVVFAGLFGGAMLPLTHNFVADMLLWLVGDSADAQKTWVPCVVPPPVDFNNPVSVAAPAASTPAAPAAPENLWQRIKRRLKSLRGAK